MNNELKSTSPAGWYKDPSGQINQERYWDGNKWTRNIREKEEPILEIKKTTGKDDLLTERKRYAHWGWRVLAFSIDTAIFYLIDIVFFSARIEKISSAFKAYIKYYQAALNRGENPGLLYADIDKYGIYNEMESLFMLNTALMSVYSIIMLALIGCTIGQLIVGLRVKKLDKDLKIKRLSLPVIIGRSLFWGIATLTPVIGLVNDLMPLWTKKRQSFHDMVVSTVVIKVRGSNKLKD